ncbi:serine/threonine protein kinase [Glycomyces tritici]|uniref:non-specific serine/threonine protein kinase n=1 Tax=Glycomyces tritici TaxID=2665176 RepID=A0ABT7YM68_9ACTN|nr:serine/threonine-protein kinase [Glycomyces tritici]MDN3239701.1 serine/threonine-protein kinase [Glycomyces tritici]
MDDTTDPNHLHGDELARLLPGFRLDPEPVSSTGMSQVFLATDMKLHHRKVAVKVMAGYLSAHPGYRKRFLREIQLMASLEHPNIMYVITAATAQDRMLYLVMPRAEGDLRDLLTRGPLDLAGTVDTVVQVAKALDFAHDHGVVHRDVKPGNILFGHEGHVYLSDFGVAKDQFGEDLTAFGETIGTRRYTAPEVFSSAAADRTGPEPDATARMLPATPQERAGDVYSLGALLHHCVTGRRPFDHLDDSAAESAQRRGELTPVSELRPQLPATLDAVVAKAMHLDPDRRYRTCGELAAALSLAVGLTEAGSALPILKDLQQRIGSVAAEPSPVPAAAPSPRSRWTGALVPVVSLLLVAGVLLYTAFGPGADDAHGTGGEPTESGSPSPDPTVVPVTGEDRVERLPVEGECLDGALEDEYVVVSCDSEQATEYVYEVAVFPEDPNPSQPAHNDASWIVCGSDGVTDFDYRWSDSAYETGEPWDPETGLLYFIICTSDV